MANKKINIKRCDNLIIEINYCVRYNIDIQSWAGWMKFLAYTWKKIAVEIMPFYKDRFLITEVNFDSANKQINIEGIPQTENETFEILDFESYLKGYSPIDSVDFESAYYYENGSGGNGNGSEFIEKGIESGKKILKSPIVIIIAGILILILIYLIIKGKK